MTAGTTELRVAQKHEALLRMKKLQLHENVIREFAADGTLNISEFGGILYWLTDEQKGLVSRVENDCGGVVYHLVHSYTTIGEFITVLFVSAQADEWQSDDEELEDGYAVSYVENVTDPELSEYGWVVVKPQFGGLVRKF